MITPNLQIKNGGGESDREAKKEECGRTFINMVTTIYHKPTSMGKS